MKRLLNLSIFGTLFIVQMLSASAAHAEVFVVVHPSNTAVLDQKAIRKIFLGKLNYFPDGNHAIPINVKEGEPITEEFNDKVMGKSAAQLKSYWYKLVLTGKGTPPREVDNDMQMIELVKANPAVIGFIGKESVTEEVKVIAKF